MLRKQVQSTHKTIFLDNTGGKLAPKEITKGLIISVESAREARLNPLLENIRNVSKINFEVLDAIDGTKIENKSGMCDGALGCVLSHVKAIELAKERKEPAVLILEDDAILRESFDEKLKTVLESAGNGWDGIWLGGINGETPTPYNESINVTLGMWSTYGYILRETVYDYCISGLLTLETTADCWYKKYLHPKYLCLRVKEDLIFHRAEVPSLVNPEKNWLLHPFGGSIKSKMSLTTKVIL